MPILGNMRHYISIPQSNLFAWGNNYLGALGIGSVANKSSPVQVGSTSSWVAVTSGAGSGGITSSGALFTWGPNGYGNLALGHRTDKSSPVHVGTLDDWTMVTLGGNAGVGLRANGTIWAWGYNNRGQLGLSADKTDKSSPVQVGSSTDWKYVNMGSSGTQILAIKTDGTLWTCGWNGSGQLGLGHLSDVSVLTKVGTATNWVQAGASSNIAAGLRSDGTLWVWGWNYYGHRGNGTSANTEILTPVQMGALNTWKSVSVGGGHCTFAIKTDGSAWAWGSNTAGQLGLGDTVHRSSPVQLGALNTWSQIQNYNTTRGIKTDGTLWCWGDNTSGEIGDNTRTAKSVPTQIGLLENWIYVAGSNGTTLALQDPYREIISNIRGMGYNNRGQLGINSTVNKSSPVVVGSQTNWASLRCGYTCMAIKTDGTLWSWGNNASGQLGLGDVANRSIPTQVGSLNNWAKVSGISSNFLAIKTDGTLWTWGGNSNLLFDPNPIIGKYSSPIQVGSLTDWSYVESGDGSTVAAIKTDGTLWTWGYHNIWGGLGLGDRVDRSSPCQVGSLTDWKQVGVSQTFMLAVKNDGTLWSWGSNMNGELGINNTVDKSSPVQVGSGTDWKKVATGTNTATVLAIKTDGTLWAWGQNTNGQLGTGDTIDRSSPVQIGSSNDWKDIPTNCGQNTIAAIKNDGTLWGCGYNGMGQLGLGDRVHRSSPTQIGSLTNWLSVSMGVKVTMGIVQP